MKTDANIADFRQEVNQSLVPAANTTHRLMIAGLAITSIVAITLAGCFVLRGRAAAPAVAKTKPLFELETKRWMFERPSTEKHTADSSQGTGFQLTFDDGPHPKYTPEILDWLRKQQIHATFFLVGENVVRYPELVKRIVAEGHEIGNHTWSHPKLSVMSDSVVRSQIKRTHDAIIAACGKAPVAFRPPYGAITARQRSWIESEFGYKTILWDIDTEDWKKTTSAAVASRIEHGLKPGSANIILAHDIHPRILPALQSLSPKLQARHFPAFAVVR
jgi:peptidoglycan/xylan/chitin deacetylase (PgdA/CDA1 family)